MDTYSNVLYVKNHPVELSILAKTAFDVDRFRPESCSAIGEIYLQDLCKKGNLYSLRGEREKAISYFQRALRLDPRYLAAWTLLGHEYLELKNWNAAITAYRQAVGMFCAPLMTFKTFLSRIIVPGSGSDRRTNY